MCDINTTRLNRTAAEMMDLGERIRGKRLMEDYS